MSICFLSDLKNSGIAICWSPALFENVSVLHSKFWVPSIFPSTLSLDLQAPAILCYNLLGGSWHIMLILLCADHVKTYLVWGLEGLSLSIDAYLAQRQKVGCHFKSIKTQEWDCKCPWLQSKAQWQCLFEVHEFCNLAIFSIRMTNITSVRRWLGSWCALVRGMRGGLIRGDNRVLSLLLIIQSLLPREGRSVVSRCSAGDKIHLAIKKAALLLQSDFHTVFMLLSHWKSQCIQNPKYNRSPKCRSIY